MMVLATLLALSNMMMNILPWGGPVARAVTALHLDPNEIFLPLVPAMILAACGVLLPSWRFGYNERRRLGFAPGVVKHDFENEKQEGKSLVRKRMFQGINLVLTLSLISAMATRLAPLPVIFMVGASMTLLINFPSPDMQLKKLESYSENVFTVISLIFAAAIHDPLR